MGLQPKFDFALGILMMEGPTGKFSTNQNQYQILITEQFLQKATEINFIRKTVVACVINENSKKNWYLLFFHF